MMKKLVLILTMLTLSTLTAFCDNYTTVYKYPDGGLLQIDRSSIYRKYGALVYYSYSDFEHVTICYGEGQTGEPSCDSLKGNLRSSEYTTWNFVKVKIRGEEIKMVLNENEYSIFDIKNGRMSGFYKIKPNTPVKLVQDYTCSLKGRRMLKKLEKEASKK